MSEITRRNMLATGAAGLAVGVMGSQAGHAQTGEPAAAAQPGAPAEAEAPATTADGVYRFKVGDMTGYMLHDGYGRRELVEGFVKNASLEEVKSALRSQGLPTDYLDIPYTQLLIDTGSETVLIDTGTGGKQGETAGRMLDAMRSAGYEPDQINRVVISHFHGDHINGLTDKEGKLLFPSAEISVPVAEWLFWSDEGQASRAPEAMRPAFELVRKTFEPLAGSLRMLQADEEVVPGLRTIEAPGHTPGHTAFRMSSGADQLIVLSDTTNHPALFARNPGWHVQFDMDPDKAEMTRRRIFEEVVIDRIPVCGYHYPFPATGRLERTGNGGYRFIVRT